MNKKSIILAVIIFSLIVAGMFIFAYLKKTEISQAPVVVEKETVAYPEIERIDAKHYFIDGVHTLVGELTMPTPCDLLEVNAVVMESFPEQIKVDFNVINNSQMCAQVLTTQRFKVSATASGEAVFGATFMGRNIELNLIPASAGEVPEDFELFIKG